MFTSSVLRLAVTVGILAAAYFFIVRPVLDTTDKAIDSANGFNQTLNANIQQSARQADVNPNVARQVRRSIRRANRQVQRALNLALADRYEDDGLNELFVDDVTPAPDCGHLLVHVVVPADRSVADALGSLRRDAARLRSEVASSISRRRAPELSFIPSTLEGGGDD